MIYSRNASLIPEGTENAPAEPTLGGGAARQPKPEAVTNTASAAATPAEPAHDAASAGDDLAGHADSTTANSHSRRMPAASALRELFGAPPFPGDRSPPSYHPVIEPLPGDDDFARFINAMQRRNEAGEIAAMGFVWFSETEDQISASVTGWISSGRRTADLERLVTEVGHGRDFKKTLRVARRRDDVVLDGIRKWTRFELANLRREYERGSIEGICALVYGVDGATRLFVKSPLTVPKTLQALDCLRGLPYYDFSGPPPGGYVTTNHSHFNDDAH